MYDVVYRTTVADTYMIRLEFQGVALPAGAYIRPPFGSSKAHSVG